MKIREAMTPNPACCTPDTGLREVAEIFVEYDCGAVPVVESKESLRPLGIVTDRDIACRAIARGVNALESGRHAIACRLPVSRSARRRAWTTRSGRWKKTACAD